MQTTYPPKVFIGIHDGEHIYLSAPSWDCGWYWGFGYLGNRSCHYHVDGLTTNTWIDGDNQFRTERLNLFDGFKKHFGDSLVVKQDKDLWTLCELFQTFYALRETAEVLGRGGSHYTTNPVAEDIKNPAEVNRINRVVLPKIFAEIYKILAPEA